MSSSSAEIVANIEELLRQILISTPALSLIRFKCVSKHWLSLISDPEFRRCHTLRNPNPGISAFFCSNTKQGAINSVGSPAGDPFKSLTSSSYRIRILQSCNGLFLCSVDIPREGEDKEEVEDEEEEFSHPPVYVVNPTTNEFQAISAPSLVKKKYISYMFVRYGLAFDPSDSPYYTVVCVNHDEIYGERHRIEIYSSETGTWVRSFEVPFNDDDDEEGRNVRFNYRSREGAVYCNGAIHWIRDRKEKNNLQFFPRDEAETTAVFERNQKVVLLHYYDLGEESLLLTAATPPVPLVVKNYRLEKKNGYYHTTAFPKLVHRYFGKSGYGCLYMIEVFKHCKTQFDVMEMKRDYSSWFVKSHVDLSHVVRDPNAFVVLFLSRDVVEIDDDDSSTVLWLHMPGKVASYNLKDWSFSTSVKLANKKLVLALDDDDYENDNYPYKETLASV